MEELIVELDMEELIVLELIELLLMELLTGRRPPFDERPQPESKLPQELLRIAERALSANPAERYQDAGPMAAEIGRWAEAGIVRSTRHAIKGSIGDTLNKLFMEEISSVPLGIQVGWLRRTRRRSGMR